MTNGSEPIYPKEGYYDGLTKREYFAAMAMQSLMIKPFSNNAGECSKWAVKYADALIKELNKENKS